MSYYRCLFVLCFSLLPLLTGAHSVDSLKQRLERATEPPSRLQTLYELSDQLYSAKPQESLSYAEEALAIAIDLDDKEMQAEINFLLIYIHYFLGNTELGIQAGERATQLARAIKNANLEADSYYILGYHYYSLGQIKQAEDAYRKCLDISLKHDYLKGVTKGSKGLGDLNESGGRYQEAIANYEQCLEIGIRIQDQRGTMIAYNDLGRIYDQMGIYDQGLTYYLRGLQLAERAEDTRVMASLYSNIASLHFFQKNYAKALEYAAQAQRQFSANEDQAGEAKILQTFGNIKFNQEKYDDALRMYTEALTIEEKRNNQRGLSFVYFNLAKTHLKKGDRKKGLEFHVKSLAIRERIGFQIGIVASTLAIGELWSSQKQFSKALDYLHQSLQLAEETRALKEMNNAHAALADCYSEMGNYYRAYQYQNAYKETQDSLFNEDRNQALAGMQVRFESEKKETQITSLEKEKILFAGIHKKDQYIQILLGIGMALLIALVFLFSRQMRLNKRANVVLQKKNNEIAENQEALKRLLQEKDVLLREVHHRVKNNLQMVSSLLNLQASEVINKSVLVSIREGKSRIDAMSIIHENLYQFDQLNEINIQPYLEQLLEHLEKAFAQKNKSIKVTLNAANIRFNIDTAIPLGLVVNELVTNAYKYAFTEQDLGEIEVSVRSVLADTYELRVTDNGRGLTPGFEIRKSGSLGLRLVHMLSTLQLKGELTYQYRGVSQFQLRFQDLRRYHEKTA